MKPFRKLVFRVVSSAVFLTSALCMPAMANHIAVQEDFASTREDHTRGMHGNRSDGSESCNSAKIGLLLPTANANVDLSSGNYMFGQFHSSFSPNFSDAWTFSLVQDSKVTLQFFDAALGPKLGKLLNADQLSLSVFDNSHNLLGSANSHGLLNLELSGAVNYSLAVSGVSTGMLGGFYLGSMQVSPPAAVPLGDTLPMYLSALLVFGWRYGVRRRR